MSVKLFHEKKRLREKMSLITCYDYTSACIAAETNIDAILVGDSLAMTMHGERDTIVATMEMMAFHTRAVVKGAPNKFIVTDLPFLSYRKSLGETVSAAQAILQAGANAVKLEGAAGNTVMIRHLVESGVPVMGHIGLTPQFINLLGGYVIQGKTAEAAERLRQEALALQEAGCFSLVIECVPSSLAARVTAELAIPTIGIGAGAQTDGQVLVWHDLLGLNRAFYPRFVRCYANGYDSFKNAINEYCVSVKNEEFPSVEHTYETG